MKRLFESIYNSSTEYDLEKVVDDLCKNTSVTWCRLGNVENNYGTVENQQSDAVASLVEKITNSIDAILTKKCLELGIDPQSKEAPRTMSEAVELFFNDKSCNSHKLWNGPKARQKQAESIQIIADGPRKETSLIIYDDGEGQHPEDFENTFLSTTRGNKNKIPFVQGKYNMGGTGAIIFCGDKRYQLVASKKFDKTGKFGFTLVRRYPMTEEDEAEYKNTWYEFFKINGEIPSFDIDELDLGLLNRKFTTGTVIKLYSYNLPPGARSVISRDLNSSLNEFLFNPALPLLTIDKKERYPEDRNLERDLFGLKRRLETQDSKYIEKSFSIHKEGEDFGPYSITCYVFKNKIDDKTVKESRESIRREFFKNGMSVVFTLNGQVHGHETKGFISTHLDMALMKDHLLIHIDCTQLKYKTRSELFMASRDRVKKSKEYLAFREDIISTLKNSELKDIYRQRRSNIDADPGDSEDLIKSFVSSNSINKDLLKLLKNTFNTEDDRKGKKEDKEKKVKPEKDEEKEKSKAVFTPKRYPSFMKATSHGGTKERPILVPQNSSKTLTFESDIEDSYFDRSDDPGSLEIALLDFSNESNTSDSPDPKPSKASDLFTITKSSPSDGTIKIKMKPGSSMVTGDLAQMKVTLLGAGAEYDAFLWIKIADPEEKQKPQKEEDINAEKLGLPKYHLVYESAETHENKLTWEKVGEANMDFDYNKVVDLMIDSGQLTSIYINMDSAVLKSYRSKQKNINADQISASNNLYISSIYFHTLFLYSITKVKDYYLKKGENDADLRDYITDLFSSNYAEFLMNFKGNIQMDTLAE